MSGENVTVRKGEAAIYAARQQKTCGVGLCLKNVRTWFGIGSKYPSAQSAWNNTPSKYKHASNTARRGYPFFFKNLSKSGGYGHIALGWDAHHVISTDQPSAGRVSIVSIDTICSEWHMAPLGYTTWLNGVGVWCRTVDASKIAYLASHSGGWGRTANVFAVEAGLAAHGWLAKNRVNQYWYKKADNAAVKLLQKYLGLTQTGVPTLAQLRWLGRHLPHFIVKP